MDRFQYLLVLAACLIVTLPLELLPGVDVWSRPRRLVRALALPVLLFSVLDAVAIQLGWWAFDPRYVTGWDLPFDLPVEEVVFFVTIPVCSILAFEAVSRTIDRDGVAVPLYTVAGVLMVGAVLAVELCWLRTGLLARRSFWVAYAICLFFQVLFQGWLTRPSAPVFIYDEDEITGIRVPWDVPVEDYLLGFAVITLTLVLWERARPRDRASVGSGAG